MIEIFKWETPPSGIIIEGEPSIYTVASNSNSYTLLGQMGIENDGRVYKPCLRIKDVFIKSDGSEAGGKGYSLAGDKGKNVCEALIALKVLTPEELSEATRNYYPEAYEYIRSGNVPEEVEEVNEEDMF